MGCSPSKLTAYLMLINLIMYVIISFLSKNQLHTSHKWPEMRNRLSDHKESRSIVLFLVVHAHLYPSLPLPTRTVRSGRFVDRRCTSRQICNPITCLRTGYRVKLQLDSIYFLQYSCQNMAWRWIVFSCLSRYCIMKSVKALVHAQPSPRCAVIPAQHCCNS